MQEQETNPTEPVGNAVRFTDNMHFLLDTKPQQVQTLYDPGFSHSVPFKENTTKQKPSIFGVEKFTMQDIMGKFVLFKACPFSPKQPRSEGLIWNFSQDLV